MGLDEIIGICGPRCTECEAYRATRKDRKALEEVAIKWTHWMKFEYQPEDIECDGCRVINGRLSKYCGDCDIRLCALEKGYETCAHCPDCPCDKIVAPPAQEALAKLKESIKEER